MRAEHLDHGHRAVAELLVEAAYDGRGEQLELGGPGGRVGAHHQPAVVEASPGCSAAATSAPTSSGQRPKTPCTRRSRSQPWSATSRRDRVVEQLRVAVVGVGAGDPARGSTSSPGLRGLRALGVDLAVARVSARARSSPSGSWLGGSAGLGRLWGSSLLTDDLAAAHGVPHPGQRRGHVGADRRGDQHLLGAGDQLGELGAALGVELGEDVVEDQDRVVAVGAQQVVRRQPQRERERPRLPVRGVALDRQPVLVRAVAEAEQQLVAVRADQRDAAVELVVAAALDLGEQRLGEVVARRCGPRGRTTAGTRRRRRRGSPRGRRSRTPCRRTGRSASTSASRSASSSAPVRARWSSQTPSVESAPSWLDDPRRAAPAVLSRELRCLRIRS